MLCEHSQKTPCSSSFYIQHVLRGVAHLENWIKIHFLLVSADFVEGQEGENPTGLLPCAPLFHQLLDTKMGGGLTEEIYTFKLYTAKVN